MSKEFDKYVAEEVNKATPINEIVDLVKEKFGKGSRTTIDRVIRRLGLEHPNKNNQLHAKIDTGSTLKGEIPMQPSKKDLALFEQHCRDHNLPFDKWRGFWHKTREFSSFFVNKEAIEAEENFAATLLEDIKKHAPRYRKRKIDPTGDHLMVLPMADIHVGKWLSREETSSEYNSEIVEERVRTGTAALVAKAKAHGVSGFVVCLGNDMLHTDDGRTTTSGTPQDNDGSWFANFRLAVKIMTDIIQELTLHGDVHLMFVPANHDWRSGFAISQVVAAAFAKHPNVHDGTKGAGVTELHRKYFVYGQNLIMFTHGDGAKEKDLHWLMATEAAEAWSKTKFRYIYMGHIHHKVRKSQGITNALIEKDKIGHTVLQAGSFADAQHNVAIEYARSPAPADGWHHRNGYVNQQAVEAFLHHPVEGQTARFTHWF